MPEGNRAQYQGTQTGSRSDCQPWSAQTQRQTGNIRGQQRQRLYSMSRQPDHPARFGFKGVFQIIKFLLSVQPERKNSGKNNCILVKIDHVSISSWPTRPG
ncbi:MAG: hypothetical protein JJD96_06275 [Thermoleophilia bacterium]|nr:hypothetical protein [Thermoleophilia bacterium]